MRRLIIMLLALDVGICALGTLAAHVLGDRDWLRMDNAWRVWVDLLVLVGLLWWPRLSSTAQGD